MTRRIDRSMMGPMNTPLGAVFTPGDTALWAAEISGILDLWLSGGRILDPSCGEGSLLWALAAGARKRGTEPTSEMVRRLYGVETEPGFLQAFAAFWRKEGLPPIPGQNLLQADFLHLSAPAWPSMDGIFANPPWVTFADLPTAEKESYRPLFLEYGLVKDRKSVLWGSSRVDLAALVWMKALKDFLKPGGLAGVFAPLSLVLNPGAQKNFRLELAEWTRWIGVWDWGRENPFPGVSTRCGFYLLKKIPGAQEAIPYHIREENRWIPGFARPWPGPGDSWHVGSSAEVLNFEPLALPPGVKCRQGVNTSGANKAYVTDKVPAGAAGEFFFPLADPEGTHGRYIFLPHSPVTGKIFSREEFLPLLDNPWGKEWSERWQETLSLRKGPMVRLQREKGYWWGLLGVGPYTYKPWKIIWKAFGSRNFDPRIMGPRGGKPVIPFQALQVSLGFDTQGEAESVLEKLKRLPIQDMLRQTRILDGKSGAQPGRMAAFFTYKPKAKKLLLVSHPELF